MEKMNRKQMKAFLKGMKRKEECLQKKRLQVKEGIEKLEDAIERNSFPRGGRDAVMVSHSRRTDNVHRTLMNARREIDEETRSAIAQIQAIYEALDQIDYVKMCLLKLDGDDQYVISVYYDGANEIDGVCKAMKLSQRSAYYRLDLAVRHLLTIYNAGCAKMTGCRVEKLRGDLDLAEEVGRGA